MKKNILSALIILTISPLLNSQTFDWAYQSGNNVAEYGSSVATDFQGNILVATSSLVSKFDSAKNLLWLRNINDGQAGAYLSTDNIGNCYVGGGCANSTFSGGNNTVMVTQQGGGDAFIAKYDSNGNILWVKLLGYSYSTDYVTALRTDADGNSYIAGIYAMYQNGYGNFLAKYDTNGNQLWIHSSWDNIGPRGMDIDNNGNCYMTGNFQGTVNFGSLNLTSENTSIFIVKYNSNGNVIWAKKDGTNYDEAYGISLNKKGDFYLTGFHGNPSTFGSTILTSSSNGVSMFIAKYDTSGTNIWAGHSDAQRGIEVSSDTSGGCFVSGWWNGTQTFGNGSSAITITSTKPVKEIFVSKYDKNGNLIWVVQPSGSSGADEFNQVMAIHTDEKNNCYITGMFSGTTTFGNTSLSAPSINSPSFFIAMLKDREQLTTSGSLLQFEDNPSFVIYPNPTSDIFQVNYTSTEKHKLILSVTNLKGQIIYADTILKFDGEYVKDIDLTKEAKGTYYIELITDGKKSVKKVILN